LKNGNQLRQRKNPDRLCMPNTPRVLDFFASLHLTIFEQAANFEFFNSQLGYESGSIIKGRFDNHAYWSAHRFPRRTSKRSAVTRPAGLFPALNQD
jgi:hypothetical protein